MGRVSALRSTSMVGASAEGQDDCITQELCLAQAVSTGTACEIDCPALGTQTVFSENST